MNLDFSTKLGKYAQEILDFYIPLLLELPNLRDNPAFMEEQVKSVGKQGLTDVATRADTYLQEKIKRKIQVLHPDWQFWGEEGDDNPQVFDKAKAYLLITDPIEGTNNFRFKKDDLWGSVIALVSIKGQEPVLGIIAQPMKRRLFLAIKNEGAYTVQFDETGITKIGPLSEPRAAFTYNNSPHFEDAYLKQVAAFFSLGKIQPDTTGADKVDRDRKTVLVRNKLFEDVEAGNLEPILFAGGIMFKTNIEIAASFVIIQEIGGKITDAHGNQWSMGTRSCLFARRKEDWAFLKKLYDETL